jgi:DNA repair protein RadC
MTIRLSSNKKIKILNSGDIATIMQEVLQREKKIDRNKEHMWLVALDADNRIMMIELISLGSNKQTIVEPMEVFSFALQKQASRIILVHNHPSGSVRPSAGDRGLTDQMMAIGKFLKLPVVDHLIINGDTFYSFVDSGLYAEIEQNTLFDLTFTKIHQLIAEREEGLKFGLAMMQQADILKAEIEKEKNTTQSQIYQAEQEMRKVTEKLQKYEIAAKARNKGWGTAEIAELTGLTPDEISNLDKNE